MSRFLKGLPAQLLLATILPLTLVLSGIAFAGVYLHHHSMRQLVSERDLRAVMATAEMLERAIPPNSDGSLSLSALTQSGRTTACWVGLGPATFDPPPAPYGVDPPATQPEADPGREGSAPAPSPLLPLLLLPE